MSVCCPVKSAKLLTFNHSLSVPHVMSISYKHSSLQPQSQHYKPPNPRIPSHTCFLYTHTHTRVESSLGYKAFDFGYCYFIIPVIHYCLVFTSVFDDRLTRCLVLIRILDLSLSARLPGDFQQALCFIHHQRNRHKQ